MKPTSRLIALVTAALALGAAEVARGAMPSGPFCGINSLYTALRAEGFRTRFTSLLTPRYVSSGAGSTVEELRLAAAEQGAHCEVLRNLSISDLPHLPCPAILHVKNEYDAPQYNHYVLCVPTSDGRVALYDAPDPLVRTEGYGLAPVWDGTAVLVSSGRIDLRRLWWRGVLRVFAAAGLVLLMAGTAAVVRHHGGRTRWLRPGPLSQSMVTLLVGLVIGGAYHAFAPQGYAAQRAAVVAISDAYFGESPRTVDLVEARSLLAQGARFIDARNASDFDEDHVPGSINVPPNASRVDRARILADLGRDRQLVVYCESPSCPYARLLARRLSRDGYSRVGVFSGGWSQWSESARREGLASASNEHGEATP